MPRKAPDGNGCVEHRMTLGNYEREQLKNTLEKSEDAAFDAALMKQAPLIIIAGSVGLAAYSLWRWVGLGSIIDRVKDTVDDFVDINKDALTLVTTGDFGETKVGQKIVNDMVRGLKHNQEKYIARITELDLIINDPNTSPNVKAQAELDKQTAKKSYHRYQKKTRERLSTKKAGESVIETLAPFLY
jgi:hypothetical protein